MCSSDLTFTVTSNATNNNTGSTIVARDSSGNFSAGTITASLSGNASSASSVAWSGVSSKPTTISGYGITDAALLASPTFTGTPAAPTAAANTNTTQLATTAFVVGQAGTAAPVMDGTAAVGTSLLYARQDHVHASDTTKASLSGATFTGDVTAPNFNSNSDRTLKTNIVKLDSASDIISKLEGV